MKLSRLFPLTLLVSIGLCGSATAQFNIGADVVTRYIFRGSDFGNSASVQPTLSFAKAGFEMGAWGSYAITADGAGANENDLFLSYSQGPFNIILTDYFFPENNDFFTYDDDAGIHILELGGSFSKGQLSFSTYYNFRGDSQKSYYAEVAYSLPYSVDDFAVKVFSGVGNGIYSAGNATKVVNLGLTVSKGPWSASYILNPDLETNYLVFGRSF